jgi:metallo-beta-lactamase class B
VRQKIIFFLSLFILVLSSTSGLAEAYPDTTKIPMTPFRIAGNLYYVGNQDLANYLIVTPKGNILINSDYEPNVPMIKASIEKLGFKFSDTKILLISQAHADHAAGSALIKQKTGAAYMVMDADVSAVESGGKTDFQYSNDPTMLFKSTKVDHVLHDNEEVKLGDTVLVAHLTPGHTKGCTTWTMTVNDKGKKRNVVILGGLTVNPGYKLLNNLAYPTIKQDYEHMWQVLNALPVDIFLGAHGVYFDLLKKYARIKDGGENPFIDPVGYKKILTEKEQEFQTELAKQKAIE